MSFLLALILVIDAICLGYSAINNERSAVAIYIIHIVFALYILVLAVRSVNQISVELHWESILHITALTLLATTLLGITAILPASPPPIATSLGTLKALQELWHSSLALYAVVCIMSFTTPQGPRLHYPPENIYSDKTVSATTNFYEDNVCGIVGGFSLSFHVNGL
jgi:hypothetical protein